MLDFTILADESLSRAYTEKLVKYECLALQLRELYECSSADNFREWVGGASCREHRKAVFGSMSKLECTEAGRDGDDTYGEKGLARDAASLLVLANKPGI